jgi:hypothetical protein
LNHIYHLSDINLPEGVFSQALRHGQDLPVVAISPPRREEEDAPAAVEAGAVPAAGAEPAAETKGEGTAE